MDTSNFYLIKISPRGTHPVIMQSEISLWSTKHKAGPKSPTDSWEYSVRTCEGFYHRTTIFGLVFKPEGSTPKFVCTDNCTDGLCIFNECHSLFINIEWPGRREGRRVLFAVLLFFVCFFIERWPTDCNNISLFSPVTVKNGELIII